MALWSEFWRDETGALISAEMLAVATVAVVGATVGMNMTTTAVNDELKELSFAIRSLDQSYSFAGHKGCRSWTAGSSYTQPDVKESLSELRAMENDSKTDGDKTKAETRKKKKEKAKGKPKQESDAADTNAEVEDLNSELQGDVTADGQQLVVDPITDETPPTTVRETDDESLIETVLEPAPEA